MKNKGKEWKVGCSGIKTQLIEHLSFIHELDSSFVLYPISQYRSFCSETSSSECCRYLRALQALKVETLAYAFHVTDRDLGEICILCLEYEALYISICFVACSKPVFISL